MIAAMRCQRTPAAHVGSDPPQRTRTAVRPGVAFRKWSTKSHLRRFEKSKKREFNQSCLVATLRNSLSSVSRHSRQESGRRCPTTVSYVTQRQDGLSLTSAAALHGTGNLWPQNTIRQIRLCIKLTTNTARGTTHPPRKGWANTPPRKGRAHAPVC